MQNRHVPQHPVCLPTLRQSFMVKPSSQRSVHAFAGPSAVYGPQLDTCQLKCAAQSALAVRQVIWLSAASHSRDYSTGLRCKIERKMCNDMLGILQNRNIGIVPG